MSHREAALGDQKLNIRRQPQEPDHVGDGGAIFAGAVRDFFVAEIHFASQTFKRLGRFDGIQILALDVFDKCDFEDPVVGIVLNDGRDIGKSCQLGGSQAPLASDQLKMGTLSADENRLDNPVCFY